MDGMDEMDHMDVVDNVDAPLWSVRVRPCPSAKEVSS